MEPLEKGWGHSLKIARIPKMMERVRGRGRGGNIVARPIHGINCANIRDRARGNRETTTTTTAAENAQKHQPGQWVVIYPSDLTVQFLCVCLEPHPASDRLPRPRTLPQAAFSPALGRSLLCRYRRYARPEDPSLSSPGNHAKTSDRVHAQHPSTTETQTHNTLLTIET